MLIVVVDGQGGGIGRTLVEKLLPRLQNGDSLLALGANALATAAMLKAGAHQAATGENAIVLGALSADVIAGPIGIVLAHAMLGEITPAMAAAIGSSRAHKVLVPVQRCRVSVAGCRDLALGTLIDEAVQAILACR